MPSKIFDTEIAGKKLKINFENWTSQAKRSLVVSLQDTEVLVVLNYTKDEKKRDFLPLTVEYLERYYATGKILGSRFLRRELRPTDEAICTARLIDRAIRPLFPEAWKNETQIIITCLSWDRENDPDIPALIGTSLLLFLSEIPWAGPVFPLRVAKKQGKMIVNPTYSEREDSEIDAVFSSVKNNGQFLVNMIDVESQEASEKDIEESFVFLEPEFKKLEEFFNQIKKEIGVEKKEILLEEEDKEFEKEIEKFSSKNIEKILRESDNKKRKESLESFEEELSNFVEKKFDQDKKADALLIFRKIYKKVFRERVLKSKKRIDNRQLDEIRNLNFKVGLLPRTHGSGFFSRGLTKTISILTLGGPADVKLLQGMEFIGKKRFIHHYNFPPYCSGEVRPLRGPSRREIGHGMLVEKSLRAVIPDHEKFPYTIRIVSEVLSSNGSTSMASVCSSSLSLMDGGVPIRRPVAGISIGLISSDNFDNYVLLTDIQGPEDHFGDMDFKVAGTEKGITAIQMDVKILGINKKIFHEALERAKKARMEILAKMKKVLAKPREKVSNYAPKIKVLKVKPEKIGEIIGPKGSKINEIIEKCEVSIDIQPSGSIYITGEDEKSLNKAVDWIKNITREVKVGEIFQGKVTRILDFGVFVEILPGQTGLVHISNLANFRIKHPSQVVKIGQIIPVKVISIDELGRINLSAKAAGFKPRR